MSKIAGVVITFHPDKKFYLHLSTYLPKLGHLYLVDNSEPGYPFDEQLITDPKITLIQDGQNEGISARLNQASNLAIKAGFEWLLTMDQDSFFDEVVLTNYLQYAIANTEKQNIAMFGVETAQNPNCIDDATQQVTILLTSGSLLNLQLFSLVGGFNTALFIDEVDHEYCYRALLSGFKIVKYPHIFLHHQLGAQAEFHSMKNLKKTTRTLHSPIRLYYMIRNFLYVRHKYKTSFQNDLKARKIDLLHRIKNNLLYGKNKLQLIKMITRAFIDFKKNNMGKFSN